MSHENDKNGSNVSLHNEEVEEKLKSLFSSIGIVLAHLNIGSLLRHIDELRLLMLNTKIDILTLSEIHLNNMIGNNELGIKNYNFVKLDRNRLDGGTAMYINENINYRMRYNLMHDLSLEYIVAEICPDKQKPFLVVSVYRPPKAEMFTQLRECFETLEDTRTEFIMLGDLNCDMWPSHKRWQAERLSDIINDFNCQQIINDPTRVT